MDGKESMREHHLCTTFKLKTDSFCRQRAGLEVLIKVTLLKKIQLETIFCRTFFTLLPSAFEVTFIKTSNPALCQQKEFVLNLKVVHK